MSDHQNDSGDDRATGFGFHLMLDLYRCNPQHLDSIDACYRFLEELTEEIGANKQSQPYVFRTPPEFEGKEGLSGWLPIVESGISIHTLTKARFVSLDVYSCRAFDKDAIERFARQFFEPEEVEVNFLLRGTKYRRD